MINIIFNVINLPQEPNNGSQSQSNPFLSLFGFNTSSTQQDVPQQTNTNQQFNQMPFFIPLFSFFQPQFVSPQQYEEMANQSFQNYQQQEINKKAPTAQKALAELPVCKLTPQRKQILSQCCCEEQQGTCSVCICDFEENEDLLRMPCGHLFHKDCIMPWIKDHNSCPTCRYELPTENQEKERERVKKMTERFTPEGMKLFELSNRIENVWNRIDGFVTNFRQLQQSNQMMGQVQPSLKELTRFDGELTNLMIELDSLQFQDNTWIRNQRKQQIVKIQAILKLIDQLKDEITNL